MSDAKIPSSLPPTTPDRVIESDATVETRSDAAREGVAHRALPNQTTAEPRPAGMPMTPELKLDRVAQTDESGRTRQEGRDRGEQQSSVIEALVHKAGFRRATDGSLQILDQVILQELKNLGPKPLIGAQDLAKAMATMSALGPPPVGPQTVNAAALGSFVGSLSRGVDDVARQTNGAPRMIDTVAGESLTAAFLKLNILDPNESLEMQRQLDEALTNLQQQMIQEMRKKLDNLFKQLEEALASAMGSLFMGAILAAIVAAIVVAIMVSIVAAVIVAVVIMAVMQMVIGQIKAQAKAAMAQARAAAERQAEQMEQMIKDQIAQIREEEMRKIQEATPVGADGQPLTEDEIRARLEPRLVDALMEVTFIFDQDGPEAAKDQGPQIIHDAMYDELIEMGLSHENADGAAWAIAAETMASLAGKLGIEAEGTEAPPATVTPAAPSVAESEGRHPGDILDNDATVVNPVPSTDVGPLEAPSDGRHPSELLGDDVSGMLGSLGIPPAALEAIANSPILVQGEERLAPRITAELTDRVSESIALNGISATLEKQVLNERSVLPFAFLGLSAVLSGSVESDEDFKDQDLQGLVGHLAEAKDRALAALAQVGSESESADLQLRNPSHI